MIDKIRELLLNHQCKYTSHAIQEIKNDQLTIPDVEAAILTGSVVNVLTHDARGPRYVVVGLATDLTTQVGVVLRFLNPDEITIITVYEIT